MGRKRHTERKQAKAGIETVKTPAAKIVLSGIGNGKMGAPRSLLITTTYGSYIFNVGESSTRVIEESKQKISRLENAFFTHTSWRNMGGAVGLTINLYQGKEDGRLRIHGPPHVENMLNASKGFCDLSQLTLDKSEISEGGFEDSTFRFEYVPLYAKKENNGEEPDTKRPKLDGTEQELNSSDVAVVFICNPKPLRRNMNMQKCKDQGIPPKRHDLIKLLIEEKDVTLDDGTVVKADDVLDSYRGDLGSIVVIECPTESFVEALDKNERLQGLEKVHCVVHFTPCNIMATEGYQRWMKSLDPSVKHILLNDHDKGQDLSMLMPLENQVLMNHLHSDIFPLLYQQTHQPQSSAQGDVEIESQTQKDTQHEEDNNIIYAGTNVVYKYREGRNNQILIRDQCPSYSWQGTYEQIAERYLTSEKMKLLKQHQQTLLASQERNTYEATYPEVVFFGTGSSKPSAMRNATGILVRLSVKNYIILDCGEGTYGQMLRFYGEEETARILRHLKAIYISHLHADHQMGVLAVLTARAEAMEERVEETSEEDRQPPYLLASQKYQHWLNLIHQKLLPSQHLYRFVGLESLKIQSPSINRPLKAVLQDLGLKEFNPVQVLHPQFSFGIILTTDAGYKMVYSGDTKPCDDLIRAGKDCDLLIHEATLADPVEAYSKNHSSFHQALEVGDNMRAKFIMLTHISQRYANVSDDPSAEFDLDRRNYGIAFDNMRIMPELLPVAASLVPIVKHLFAGIRRCTEYPPIIDEEIDILLNIKSQEKDCKSDTEREMEETEKDAHKKDSTSDTEREMEETEQDGHKKDSISDTERAMEEAKKEHMNGVESGVKGEKMEDKTEMNGGHVNSSTESENMEVVKREEQRETNGQVRQVNGSTNIEHMITSNH